MAKVTITLEDDPEGNLDVKFWFDPKPVKDEPMTEAQVAGEGFLDTLRAMAAEAGKLTPQTNQEIV